ncbi:hypothetical protein EJ04DRAFT_549939 [Polyplosphaeria fusca]|uniref:Uncharacterized protein n=1 Tax=Polyplosphaeria fusca TaxID=682080 RepID=A0A9P4R8M0_9PLEO|nr:hypothetical protein EJ04DRAFT_549939 [Polyplosphaeria fusca]
MADSTDRLHGILPTYLVCLRPPGTAAHGEILLAAYTVPGPRFRVGSKGPSHNLGSTGVTRLRVGRPLLLVVMLFHVRDGLDTNLFMSAGDDRWRRSPPSSRVTTPARGFVTAWAALLLGSGRWAQSLAHVASRARTERSGANRQPGYSWSNFTITSFQIAEPNAKVKVQSCLCRAIYATRPKSSRESAEYYNGTAPNRNALPTFPYTRARVCLREKQARNMAKDPDRIVLSVAPWRHAIRPAPPWHAVGNPSGTGIRETIVGVQERNRMGQCRGCFVRQSQIRFEETSMERVARLPLFTWMGLEGAGGLVAGPGMEEGSVSTSWRRWR